MSGLELMLPPFVACMILVAMLSYLGLHVIAREVIFVDLSLAQMAALGSLSALLFHVSPDSPLTYVFALLMTAVGAVLFALTRSSVHGGSGAGRVPQEAFIGIVYVVAAASAILLLSQSAEGNEELKRTLVGDILLVRPGEVLRAFALYAVIGIVHLLFRKSFLMISFEPERAVAEGVSVRGWDFLFYVLFGFVVTSFVRIGGVLMIFSYLIVPAVCANLLVDSLKAKLLVGWLTATTSSIVGLYGSYKLDLPTGAAIVCALGGALLFVAVAARIGRKAGK